MKGTLQVGPKRIALLGSLSLGLAGTRRTRDAVTAVRGQVGMRVCFPTHGAAATCRHRDTTP